MRNIVAGLIAVIIYSIMVIMLHWFMPFEEANAWTAGILWSLLGIIAILKLILWWHRIPRDPDIGIRLFPETATTRAVWWRADRYGLYLLFFNDGYLMAGITLQYPVFISGNPSIKPGLSLFSWDRDFYKEYIKGK